MNMKSWANCMWKYIIDQKGIIFIVGAFKQVVFILKPYNDSEYDTLLIPAGKLSFQIEGQGEGWTTEQKPWREVSIPCLTQRQGDVS